MAGKDWFLREAIIWAHDLHDERLNDPAFDPPPAAAILMYEQDGTWHRAMCKVLNALRYNDLAAFRMSNEGLANPIAAGFWNNFAPRNVNWRDTEILICAADVIARFPTPAPSRLRDLPERMPPDGPFVTLSQAVSWIAFHHAMDWGQLWDAVEADPAGVADSQIMLAKAIHDLATSASGGDIPMRGKYLNDVGDNESVALTSEIDPIRLNDFARLDILGDGLRHGTGLLWTHGPDALERAIPTGRADSYTAVTVERQSLVEAFPPLQAITNGTPPLVTIGDMTMPGDDFDLWADVPVLTWWSVLEVAAWIMTGSAAYVAYVCETAGSVDDPYGLSVACAMVQQYVARKHCKCVAKDQPADGRWEACTCTGDAGRLLLEAIRSGKVTAIQKLDGRPIKLAFHDLVGIGQRPTCYDWLELRPALMFSSAEVIDAFDTPPVVLKIPATVGGVGTTGAEGECRLWLAKAFSDDPDHKRKKDWFRAEAIAKFGPRLSGRSFNFRVWPELAREDGRTIAGAPKKRNA